MKSRTYRHFTQVSIVFAFSQAMVVPFLAPYLREAGFSSWQISLMFTVFPCVSIIFLPFVGRLADVSSRRFIIWAGVWLEIIALILYLLGGHWIVIVAARLLDAIAASTVGIIALAKIEDCVGERSRGRDTGLSLSLSYLGELFGPLAGGLLADYFFIEAPFITAAAILLILSFFLRSRGFGQVSRATLELSSFSWFGPLRLFWSHRALKGMGILGMVMHATNPAMRIFLPLLIVERLGMSYKAIGLAMFFYGINHLWQGFFGAWGDRIGHSRVVLAGTGVYALCFFGIFFAPSYFWLLALLFVLGCGGSMWNVGAWSLMSEIGEREKIEAQVLTSYMSIAQIGSLISFLLSAWIVSIWGFSFIFLANGIVIIFGTLLAATYFKPRTIGATAKS